MAAPKESGLDLVPSLLSFPLRRHKVFSILLGTPHKRYRYKKD